MHVLKLGSFDRRGRRLSVHRAVSAYILKGGFHLGLFFPGGVDRAGVSLRGVLSYTLTSELKMERGFNLGGFDGRGVCPTFHAVKATR